jgi:C1A family cysteine protease
MGILIGLIKIFFLNIFLLFFALNVSAANMGDIDDSRSVDLQDVILALQVLSGKTPSSNIFISADVNEDDKIGLEEVIYGLRFLSKGLQLGDTGKPDNYEQTIDQFKRFFAYDSFAEQLPASFNWKTKGKVTSAKDQGGCGSCWAFASVGALESKILIKGGSLYNLSEQQQISCNSNMGGCRGGNMTALQFWGSQGPMLESCTEYCQCNGNCNNLTHCIKLNYNTKNYYTVNTSDLNEVKSSIYNDGPTYFRYDVYADFEAFWNNGSSGQVYKNINGADLGGHAVLIIGWDDSKNAWLCKNSWGETEGPNGDGTFWIAYSGHLKDLHFGMANFTITDLPQPSDRKIPVYRFADTIEGNHFYTASESEKNMVTNEIFKDRFRDEGIAFYSYGNQVAGTGPIYRFASPVYGDHFYTISEDEKNTLLNQPEIWRYEGIVFYAYFNQVAGTDPVYRFASPVYGDHFYTISEDEKNTLLNQPELWRYEGIAFYAYPKP